MRGIIRAAKGKGERSAGALRRPVTSPLPVLSRKHMVIACVSLPRTGGQIIRAAGIVAAAEGLPLGVVTVLPAGSQADPSVIEQFCASAAAEGASLTILYNDNPAFAVVDFIKHNGVSHVVTGVPLASAHGSEPDGGRFISLLRSVYPKELTVVPVPAQQAFVSDAVCTLPLQLLLSEMQPVGE